jgi:hypothetical protein
MVLSMARSKTSWQTKDTIKWKRKATGHYEMWAWYIWKEPEIHAEVMKVKGKWRYRLWTWGSADPAPLEASHEKFSTAKEVKSRVVELILSEEPNITLTRKSKFGII